MAFLRHELAIDLGTANTVIFKDDQVVLDEPSIIAMETQTEKVVPSAKKRSSLKSTLTRASTLSGR